MVRIDSRYTLVIKPDHVRTYERMAKIAQAYSCPELIPRINALVDEVKAEGEKSQAEWRRLAQRGIALLSLSTIIAARTGGLTDEFLEERIRIGIEDMYTPANVGADVYPVLPWLTEADLDGAPA
jgi:hypothetical protein